MLTYSQRYAAVYVCMYCRFLIDIDMLQLREPRPMAGGECRHAADRWMQSSGAQAGMGADMSPLKHIQIPDQLIRQMADATMPQCFALFETSCEVQGKFVCHAKRGVETHARLACLMNQMGRCTHPSTRPSTHPSTHPSPHLEGLQLHDRARQRCFVKLCVDTR